MEPSNTFQNDADSQKLLFETHSIQLSDLEASRRISAGSNTTYQESMKQSDVESLEVSTAPSHKTERNQVQQGWRNKLTDSRVSPWLLEISAAVFSVVCLLCNVAVLRALDGRKYKSWHVAGVDITPNTLISITSTLSKSGFLLPVAEGLSQLKWTHFQREPHSLLDIQRFDEASRGPLGSLKLLLDMRRRALAASAGAIITVLAFAIDPFTQQILSYPTKSSAAGNETASIAVARAFDSGTLGGAPGLSDAMMRGIYAPQLQVEYTCTTAACSWPSYETLAICSSCENVTDAVVATCGEVTQHDGGDVGENGEDVSAEFSVGCNYTTPAGSTMYNAWVAIETHSNGTESTWDPEHMEASSMFITTTAVSQTHLIFDDGSIAVYSIMSLQPSGNLMSDTSMPKGTTYDCSFRWCAYRHESTRVVGGTLSEESVLPEMLYFNGSDCVNSPGGSICSATPSSLAGTSETPPNKSQIATSEDVFWVNREDTRALLDLLTSNLVYQVGNPNEGLPWSPSNIDEKTALVRSLMTMNNGNMSQTLQQIATSLTNQVREGPNSTTLSGEAELLFVYIHVNWPWLLYPAMLVVLACAFLAMAMSFSLEREAVIWKSSSLALSFHGLRGWESEELDIRSMSAMEKTARGMRAQIGEGEDGTLAFVRA